MDRQRAFALVIALAAAAAAGLPFTASAQADAKAAQELFKKATGKDADKLTIKDFLVDQGAAGMSAASLVGLAGAATVVDDTKDYAALLSPFDSSGKGAAVVISPARVRNPVPRIDLMTEYVPKWHWRAVAGIALSGAQNKSNVDGKDYRLRALSLSTSAYLDGKDDPIVRRATDTLRWDEASRKTVLNEKSCAASVLKAIDDAGLGGTGGDTSLEGESLKDKAAKKDAAAAQALTDFKACVEKQDQQSRNRWFAGRWSIALGTGDVQPAAGGANTRLGTVLAGGVTLGRPLSTAGIGDDAEVLSGIAVTLASRVARGEPVLASLASGTVQRQDSSLFVARLMVGTESLRLLGEGSNHKKKHAATGTREFKHALGVDARVMKDSWLSLRYGRRATTGGGDEAATLLSLTLGGELLSF